METCFAEAQFMADCGHRVYAKAAYIKTERGRWCSPMCATENTPERKPKCRWRECGRDGEPRNIEVVMRATADGHDARLLITFSSALALCDEHEAMTRRVIEEVVHAETDNG